VYGLSIGIKIDDLKRRNGHTRYCTSAACTLSSHTMNEHVTRCCTFNSFYAVGRNAQASEESDFSISRHACRHTVATASQNDTLPREEVVFSVELLFTACTLYRAPDRYAGSP